MKNTILRLIGVFFLLALGSKAAYAGAFNSFASWGIDGRALASNGFVPIPDGTFDLQEVTDPQAVATVGSQIIKVSTPDGGGGVQAPG